MIGRNIYNYSDNYVFAGKESNHETNDSFGKGFHALIANVLNCLMTELITAVKAEVPHAFSPK